MEGNRGGGRDGDGWREKQEPLGERDDVEGWKRRRWGRRRRKRKTRRRRRRKTRRRRCKKTRRKGGRSR